MAVNKQSINGVALPSLADIGRESRMEPMRIIAKKPRHMTLVWVMPLRLRPVFAVGCFIDLISFSMGKLNIGLFHRL